MNIDFTQHACRKCGRRILNRENAMMCPNCRAVIHKSCWRENGGCVTPGCNAKYVESDAALGGTITADANTEVTGVDYYKTMDPKMAEKTIAMLNRYGLDGLSNQADVDSLRRIVSELTGTGLLDLGAALTWTTSATERLQVHYQRTMIEQNFMIIRQLDRINKNLEKLLEK